MSNKSCHVNYSSFPPKKEGEEMESSSSAAARFRLGGEGENRKLF